MNTPAPTTSGTTADSSGGFPPFKTETFPSQFFWLTITFVFLFVVLWRYAGPRIQSTIAERLKLINEQLKAAEVDRRDAENVLATYQNTLVEARQRGRTLIEERRARSAAESEQAEAAANTEGQEALAKAEERLAALRAEARQHIARAAQDAVVDIVARLTGETVSTEDAAAAIRATQGQ
jgi:F-type H+-transporting ATPase subunit b